MRDEIAQSRGYQSLQVLTDAVGLDVAEIAPILELDQTLVGMVLQSGDIQKNLPNYEEVSGRFWMMLSVMSHFAEVSDYDKREMQGLFSPHAAQEYKDARVPPPWYPVGVKNYLSQNKLKGLDNCVKWLGGYSVGDTFI